MLMFSLFRYRYSWKRAALAFLSALLIAVGVVLVRGDRVEVAPDQKHATYIVEGKRVALGGAYSYFGNEAVGDLNGDGKDDIAFLFVAQPGGSGSFYYVAVALAVQGGYRGTNAMLLGDRIAPQTTRIQDGVLTVNYADRKSGEPFSARPSVGISKFFRIRNDSLVQTQ